MKRIKRNLVVEPKEEIKAELPVVALFVRNRREELGYGRTICRFCTGLSLRFVKEFERGKILFEWTKLLSFLTFLEPVSKLKLGTYNEK